jgi:hypothetical protein
MALKIQVLFDLAGHFFQRGGLARAGLQLFCYIMMISLID